MHPGRPFAGISSIPGKPESQILCVIGPGQFTGSRVFPSINKICIYLVLQKHYAVKFQSYMLFVLIFCLF